MPVVVTPLPFLQEYGIEDGKNCYILKFDCSNIDEVAKKMTKIPKFIMKLPEDIYGKLLAPSKSTYQEKLSSRWLVAATDKYFLTRTGDSELSRIHKVDKYIPNVGEQWEVSFKRKKILYHDGFVNVIKEIKEEKECTIESKKTKEKNCKKEEHCNT